MSEVSSALGIESVEWLAQGADSLTVRVGGRWRRRRPTFSGPPLLVIEAGPTRQRFPAMPEPPSLSGAAPGTWQMSFSVPAAVAKRPGARAWLQLGSMVVPLPVPVDPADPIVDDETLAQRRVRSAELAAESAARRVAEAEAQASRLSDRVAELEARLRDQAEAITERDRARRAAEQRAHAEQALRLELEDQLAAAGAPTEPDAGQELRVHELEAEAAHLRRALDEAEHVARAAEAARRRAEARLHELSASSAEQSERLRAEFALAAADQPIQRRRPRPVPAPEDRLWLEREADVIARRQSQALAALRTELAERTTRTAHAFQAIQEIRAELEALRTAPAAEAEVEVQAVVGPELEAAEAEVAEPEPAPEVREPEPEPAAPAPSEPESEPAAAAPEHSVTPQLIETERLAQALERLREEALAGAAAAASPAPRAPAGPWLRRALRRMARSDPASAAGLLAVLLRAQPAEAEDAARLLAKGPLRRGVSRGVARVRGQRGRYAAVGQLLHAPPSLEEIEVEPLLAFALAAAMIEASWTVDERFTIAYDASAYLHIRQGSPVSVTDTAAGPVATTIVCPSTALPRVLAGRGGGSADPETTIRGETRPLETVRAWLDRAQSG